MAPSGLFPPLPSPAIRYEAAQIALERLGREVNVSIVNEDEWRDDHNGFLDTIRERPPLRLSEL
jgi:hypothetical protein